MARVLVVGAGVIGLSCADRLLEEGYDVTLVARESGTATTSAVAAALWYPYLVRPRERVVGWSAAAYLAFADLAAAAPESGVRMLPGTEVVPAGHPDPWWAAAVPDLVRSDRSWSFTAPVVDMGVYLPWLTARVLGRGATLTERPLEVLPTPGDTGADVVVNCAGLGARELVGDRSLAPVQGQVVLVEQLGLDRWWLDESGPTYVVPRGDHLVVGGTEVHGASSLEPDEAVSAGILERAAALVPELRRARVLGHRVGLRPARPQVRLERAGPVVHCYGHGGAGVSLSWGCADEVAALVGEVVGGTATG